MITDVASPRTITAPQTWPPLWHWFSSRRRNGAHLFPQDAYRERRLEQWIGPHRLVVINDPQDARLICDGEGRYRLSNIQARLLRPVLGNGLALAEGDAWQRQRATASAICADVGRRLDGAACATAAAELVAAMADTDSPVCLLTMLKRIALDLTARLVFEIQEPIATPDVLSAITEVEHALDHLDLADALGAPTWIATPKSAHVESAVRQFDALILDRLAHCAGASAQRCIHSAQNQRAKRDLAISLISGFESVALTSFWGLIELAHAPNALTESGIDRFVDETLRLYPPLPFILRVAVQDDARLRPAITRNSLVCISPWIIHRHDAHWRHPNAFQPNRFETSPARPDAFIPFGVGARRCIGQQIGRRMIVAIVSAVAARWRIHFLRGGDVKPVVGLSLRPDRPVEVALRPGFSPPCHA